MHPVLPRSWLKAFLRGSGPGKGPKETPTVFFE